ncbi:cupin domain-containing protein [Synechocystis sp. LKSZ1]|uniref:cupin domain-containing protein n=1 Tax=Synechocystis sp. LKSZ1 TaxID=3144951 RepID=UPI00336BBEF7
MNYWNALLSFITVVLCQSAVLAIEPTSSVKVTPVLKTETSWDGQPIVYPPGQAEITGLIVEIAPGAETGWHLHPVPSFGLMLAGELTVTLRDGQVKILKAGDALAEVVNVAHNGRNLGTVPVKLIVFYAGAVGQPLTIEQAVK